MRDGFRDLTRYWRHDSFDALMARIDMLGDWVVRNGGPEALQPDESRLSIAMMSTALRAGKAGANPKPRVADQ